MYILSISEQVLLFISGFGTLQGVLLAFLLYFHPKADRSVNIFLARKTLVHYQRSIRHLFSDTESIDLNWARLLINGYLLIVEEAKRLLIVPKNINYTILSVGFEAGFNSKTTFNTVFKKFTGLTPTDFREKEKMSLVQIETTL